MARHTTTPIDKRNKHFEATVNFPDLYKSIKLPFMDLEKFMQTYESELKKKLEKINYTARLE